MSLIKRSHLVEDMTFIKYFDSQKPHGKYCIFTVTWAVKYENRTSLHHDYYQNVKASQYEYEYIGMYNVWIPYFKMVTNEPYAD